MAIDGNYEMTKHINEALQRGGAVITIVDKGEQSGLTLTIGKGYTMDEYFMKNVGSMLAVEALHANPMFRAMFKAFFDTYRLLKYIN